MSQPANTTPLADRLEELAHLLIDQVWAKADAATLPQLAATPGVVIDKMLLLRQQPTAITADHATLTDAERADRVGDVLATAWERAQNGHTPRER